jgi:predicted ABC-type ATPase
MPTIYVIAGPNGIGKTTSSFDILPSGIPVINSDEIAKEARAAGIIAANTQEYSNQEAARLVDEQIGKRNTFAIETNLSDVDTWKFLIKVQQLGYELHVKYYSTDQLQVLNDRIAIRVKLGDHFVRPDIVEQRYMSGLKLLDHYFSYPDVLELFDNTDSMVLVGEFKRGEIVVRAEQMPAWVEKYLGSHLRPRSNSNVPVNDLSDIDAVRKAYQALKESSHGKENP